MTKVSITNIDNDTKFYVVNDATPDKTYEYATSGGQAESYNLNSGNTSPRGVATTAAGDKTWVVDANQKVYVYNTSGVLLGSWTAGSLNTKAKVEDITVYGNDVWIVDAYSDKVYKYANAATRTSGTQNATSSFKLTSSFSLASDNRDPKGIVTDGTSLWVVNDSTVSRQGVQIHPDRPVSRQLAHRRAQCEADGTDDQSRRAEQHLDRRQRHQERVSVPQCHQRDFRRPKRLGRLPSGRRQHQPARHRRSARSGQPAGDRDASSLRAVSAEAALRGNDAALASMYYEPAEEGPHRYRTAE